MSKPLLQLPSNLLQCFNISISPGFSLDALKILIIPFSMILRKHLVNFLERYLRINLTAIKKQANPMQKAFGRKRPAPINLIGIRKSNYIQYVWLEIVRNQKCRPFALMKRGGRVLTLCHEPLRLLVRYSVGMLCSHSYEVEIRNPLIPLFWSSYDTCF